MAGVLGDGLPANWTKATPRTPTGIIRLAVTGRGRVRTGMFDDVARTCKG